MKRALLLLCGLLIVVWGLPCQASVATYEDSTSNLYNVVVQTNTGLTLGTYNVEFVYGYNPNMLDIDYGWTAWALDCVNERLNDNGFTTVAGSVYQSYYIPSADNFTPYSYNYRQADYTPSDGWHNVGYEITAGQPAPPPWVYADFSPASVPIPGAVWLLGSGLIGIVGIRKKIRK